VLVDHPYDLEGWLEEAKAVARAVADRLGYTYLDSGAMYRCVALLVNEWGEGLVGERGREPDRARCADIPTCRAIARWASGNA
jgi:cytidylate kinase